MKKHSRREKMANKLLERGSASMKEILTASYGVWPPKGLDIDPAVIHDLKIKFSVVDNDKAKAESMKYMGMVYLGGKTIYLNEQLENFGRLNANHPPLNTIMGHEATHLLQGTVTHNNHRINETVLRVTKCNLHYPEKGQLRRTFNTQARKKATKHVSYYSEGIEVQARLHQLMAEGYQKWGRLPQNREELWTAFSCFGFDPPPKVAAILEGQTAVDPSLKDFKKLVDVYHGADWGIQYFYDVLSAPAKDMFWQETLPALYASLIEMYGDTQGRKRFSIDAIPSKAPFEIPPQAKSGVIEYLAKMAKGLPTDSIPPKTPKISRVRP